MVDHQCICLSASVLVLHLLAAVLFVAGLLISFGVDLCSCGVIGVMTVLVFCCGVVGVASKFVVSLLIYCSISLALVAVQRIVPVLSFLLGMIRNLAALPIISCSTGGLELSFISGLGSTMDLHVLPNSS